MGARCSFMDDKINCIKPGMFLNMSSSSTVFSKKFRFVAVKYIKIKNVVNVTNIYTDLHRRA